LPSVTGAAGQQRLDETFAAAPEEWVETYEQAGDLKSREVCTRLTSRFPLKGFSMTPLLSDSSQASKRIRPQKPVIKGGIFPPNYSWAQMVWE